jgi:hypothetical protein
MKKIIKQLLAKLPVAKKISGMESELSIVKNDLKTLEDKLEVLQQQTARLTRILDHKWVQQTQATGSSGVVLWQCSKCNRVHESRYSRGPGLHGGADQRGGYPPGPSICSVVG